MRHFTTVGLSLLLYLLSTMLGLISLLYPFFSIRDRQLQPAGALRLGEMPLMLLLVLCICLAVLVYESQSQAANPRLVALLGMLVAINSALRFIEVAIPGPGGFTPIFFLIILSGYVFGGRIGFLVGALTMFVSALVTGGVGPWLPSQMFCAGWVGLSAPLCRPLVRLLDGKIRGWEVIVLAGYGFGWGILYGAIMNLWTWPFLIGPASQYWAPGTSLKATLSSYALYYLVTSLAWDLAASTGNLLLIATLGAPTLRALRRFQRRFTFRYRSSIPRPAVQS